MFAPIHLQAVLRAALPTEAITKLSHHLPYHFAQHLNSEPLLYLEQEPQQQ
jgi:hypothetical protein